MRNTRFATDVFKGIGDFSTGFDINEVAKAAREETAREQASIAARNGRTTSEAMLAEAGIQAAERNSQAQHGSFMDNMLPGVIGGFGSALGSIDFGGGGGFGKMATLDSTPQTVMREHGSSVSLYDPYIYDDVGDF